MRNRLIFLGLAAMVTALFALPAVASAGEWSIHNAKGTLPTFSVLGNNPKLTASGEPNIECETTTGFGEYTNASTGSVDLTFRGCKESFTASTCTSAGQLAGTITTGSHQFDNVHLEPTTGTTAETNQIGILITGGFVNDFATFTCKPLGVTTTITVTGKVIGQVTSPTCGGAATKTGGLTFTTKAGVFEPTQQWGQVTTTGIFADLVSDVTVGANTTEHTSAEDAAGTLTFNEAVTATCL